MQSSGPFHPAARAPAGPSRAALAALVLANLAPLAGVLLWDWRVFDLVLLFWAENVVIGAVNVLRMLCARPPIPIRPEKRAFRIVFFCVHYGLFTFIHGMFVLTLFGSPVPGEPAPPWVWFGQLDASLLLPFAALVASHGISFVTNYLGRGEYRRADLNQLFTQPYSRVVVLHLVVLLGGALVFFLGSPLWGLLLLLGLKTALDLRSHRAEHRRLGEPTPTPASPGA